MHKLIGSQITVGRFEELTVLELGKTLVTEYNIRYLQSAMRKNKLPSLKYLLLPARFHLDEDGRDRLATVQTSLQDRIKASRTMSLERINDSLGQPPMYQLECFAIGWIKTEPTVWKSSSMLAPQWSQVHLPDLHEFRDPVIFQSYFFDKGLVAYIEQIVKAEGRGYWPINWRICSNDYQAPLNNLNPLFEGKLGTYLYKVLGEELQKRDINGMGGDAEVKMANAVKEYCIKTEVLAPLGEAIGVHRLFRMSPVTASSIHKQNGLSNSKMATLTKLYFLALIEEKRSS